MTYERGEHYVEERYSRTSSDNSRSHYAHLPRDSQRYVELPAQRVVDDYSRVDYDYARPQNIRQPADDYYRPYSTTQTSHSTNGHGSIHSTHDNRMLVETRPGSPGPVAGAGNITNSEHGFTIELDVEHFRPEEIKVVLTAETLCVTGERIESGGHGGQSLRRSFSRKYSIPTDVALDSIRSHLSESGVLVIKGSRKSWQETSLLYHPIPEAMTSGARSINSTV